MHCPDKTCFKTPYRRNNKSYKNMLQVFCIVKYKKTATKYKI